MVFHWLCAPMTQKQRAALSRFLDEQESEERAIAIMDGDLEEYDYRMSSALHLAAEGYVGTEWD